MANITVIVAPNDTLSKIANRVNGYLGLGCNVTWQQIAVANGLRSPYTIRPSQTLIVPCGNSGGGGGSGLPVVRFPNNDQTTWGGGGGVQTSGVTIQAQVDLSIVNWNSLAVLIGIANPVAGIITYLTNSPTANSFKNALAARGYTNIQLRAESSYSIPSALFIVADSRFNKTNDEVARDIKAAANASGYVIYSSSSIYVSVVPKGTTLQDTNADGTPKNPSGCDGLKGSEWVACQLGVTKTTTTILGIGVGLIIAIAVLSRD